MSVSASWRFWVKMMLKTAWERLLVSFMFVAATVLGEQKPRGVTSHPVVGYEGHPRCQHPRAPRAVLLAVAMPPVHASTLACPPHPLGGTQPAPQLQPGTQSAVTRGVSLLLGLSSLNSPGGSPGGCDAGRPHSGGEETPTIYAVWGGDPGLPER